MISNGRDSVSKASINLLWIVIGKIDEVFFLEEISFAMVAILDAERLA